MRAATHRTYRVSPGTIVFQRDMLLPIPVVTNFHQLRQRRQVQIDQNALRDNTRRHFHDYSPGDEVLLITYKPNKLQQRAIGPFTIAQVHVNGTVTIERQDNVYERVNIRRVRPYFRRL